MGSLAVAEVLPAACISPTHGLDCRRWLSLGGTDTLYLPLLPSLGSGREVGALWPSPGLISSPKSLERCLRQLLGPSTGSPEAEGSVLRTPNCRHGESSQASLQVGVGSQGGSPAWWRVGACFAIKVRVSPLRCWAPREGVEPVSAPRPGTL